LEHTQEGDEITRILLFLTLVILSAQAGLAESAFSSSTDQSPGSNLNIVSIANTYLPPHSNQSFSHLSTGLRSFNESVFAAKLRALHFSTFHEGITTQEDLVRAIVQFDAEDLLTVVYIASHGSPEGLVLSDGRSFDELYDSLEAGTKGTLLLIMDSCFAGNFADTLNRHKSTRIFAITGTRGSTLERWYSKTGSFSEALSETIQKRCSPGQDGKLTLGQLYDFITRDIATWNAHYAHQAAPISDPGLYGPRDLVVFTFN
jgi:hypothetical protein